ncbi:MAG: hypothetical protein ISR91_05950 [Candidatus Delongbacteria bacterium]|nr:hypothetical protein [Candidatus Delongbacteria bacterium]
MDRCNTNRCAPPSIRCSERGATIVEMAVALLMSSIVLVGLGITLVESKNQMERDLQMHEIYTYGEMSMRLAEKYVKNSRQFRVNGSNSFTVNTSLTEQDLNVNDVLHSTTWDGVYLNTQLMDPYFPPQRLRQGEKIEVLQFHGLVDNTRFLPPGSYGSLIVLDILIRYSHETDQGTYTIDKEFKRNFFAPNIVLYNRDLSRQNISG